MDGILLKSRHMEKEGNIRSVCRGCGNRSINVALGVVSRRESGNGSVQDGHLLEGREQHT